MAANPQKMSKKQNIENERKKSYIEVAQKTLNQSANQKSTVMRTNPSN